MPDIARRQGGVRAVVARRATALIIGYAEDVVRPLLVIAVS
jgi:hypothetical protein